jgi:WD40 repeat protein
MPTPFPDDSYPILDPGEGPSAGLEIRCPNPACGQIGRVSPQHLGRSLRCRFCRTKFRSTPVDRTTTQAAGKNAAGCDVAAPATQTGVVLDGASPNTPPDPPAFLPEGTDPSQDQLPTSIGRYEIRSRLGDGAFGCVYRAYDPQLRREIALKVPRPGTLSSPLRRERFLGDARAAARLRHPNIVPVYDAGETGDDCYIASAFIEGQTLADALDSGQLDPRRSVEIIRALAEALAYAHSQAIVHRDIKPENVMLDREGKPHLIDFGLARLRDAQEAEPEEVPGPQACPADAYRTRQGAMMGTPAYMSPEQAAGQSREAGPASDQYSLGVTLYELLCGQVPFPSMPLAALNHCIRKQPPPVPRGLRPDLPEDLETICLKTLEKKPEDRYPSCRELAEDLRCWLQGEPVSVRTLPLRERWLRWCRRQPALASALALATIAVLAAAVLGVVFGFTSARQAGSEGLLRAAAEEHRGKAEEQHQRAEDKAREADEQRQKAVSERNDAIKAQRQEEVARSGEAEARRQEAEARKLAERAQAEVNQALQRAKRDLYFQLIRLAERELRDGQPARALQSLQGCPSDVPRGWEWHHLTFEAQRERRRDLGLHGLAISPPRGPSRWLWVAWANSENRVILRRPTASNPGKTALREFRAPWPVHCLAFSADGRYLAVGTTLGQVLVWDLGTKEDLLPENPSEVFTDKYQGRVTMVAFSPLPLEKGPGAPGPQRFASAGEDRSVHVSRIKPDTKDPFTDQQLFAAHSTAITWLAFDHTGQNLLTASADTRLRYWSADTGKDQTPSLEGFTAGALNPLRSHLGLAKLGGTIEIRDPKTKNLKLLCLFRDHSSDVRSLVFAPNNIVLSVDEEGFDKVWEIKKDTESKKDTPQELTTVRSVGGCALDPGTNYLAWMPDRQTIRLRILGSGSLLTWNVETGRNVQQGEEPSRKLETYSEYVHSVAWSPKGNCLLTGSSIGRAEADGLEGGEFKLWDAATGQLRLESGSLKDPVWTVACSKNDLLAWAGRGGSIFFWDGLGKNGRPRPLRDAHLGDVNQVAFSPDGLFLASGCTDGTVGAWTQGGVLLRRLSLNASVLAVAFSHDSRLLAGGDEQGNVILWEPGSGKPIRSLALPNGERVNGLTFSPDGQWLAGCGDQGSIQLWEIAGKRRVESLVGHSNGTLALAFSPDSQRLASAGRDKTVRLWEPATRREVLALPVRCGLRYGLAFSPDGQELAVATAEGVIRWQGKKVGP